MDNKLNGTWTTTNMKTNLFIYLIFLYIPAFSADISTHFLGRKANLPDTGLYDCYNATAKIACPTVGQDFYGQDAHYNTAASSQSYTVLNPTGISSVTVDNKTGLMWITNPATDAGFGSNTYTWLNALSACVVTMNSGAGYAGYKDWRLPNFKELISILKFFSSEPLMIDYIAFPETFTDNPYWTSTTPPSNGETVAMGVDFAYSYHSPFEKTSSMYVRCVRGGAQ